jgi:hypothetical protein
MSGTTDQFEGGCFCGAVRFATAGQQKGIIGSIVKVATSIAAQLLRCLSYSSTRPVRQEEPGGDFGSTFTCESLRGPLATETHFHVGIFDGAGELRAELLPKDAAHPA